MYSYLKSLSWFLIDSFFSMLMVPAGFVFLAYRRIGSARLKISTRILKNIGVFPIRRHYYEPLFDDRSLLYPLDAVRNLPGIDFNEVSQLALLDSLHFANELNSLELNREPLKPTEFSINNSSFGSGDAEFLYQIIRKIKPRKFIEIGSGNSTKIAKLALDKNLEFDLIESTHICIEPYEQPWLETLGNIKIIRDRIETCKFDWTNELAHGDILFIDSSHIIRPQGDVLKEYLEIIPSLPSGVIVHIHDIFTPRDYSARWIVDDVKFWNEQYLLEALLSLNSSKFEIIAALNFLKHSHYEKLKNVCPYLSADREPGSFYFITK